MTDLPYVNAYGKLKDLFKKIKEASVPPKFTQDYLSTSLEFTSSSDRAFPGLLKRLGFIDGSNVPTEAYKEYRDDTRSKQIMARQIRTSYGELYKINEYAHKLSKDQLSAKVKQVTGLAEGDQTVQSIVGTFSALRDLADFESSMPTTTVTEEETASKVLVPSGREGVLKLGLSYTIVLNLPPTKDIEVFNAIFKSLKENILKE